MMALYSNRSLLLLVALLLCLAQVKAQEIRLVSTDDVEIVDDDASPSITDETSFGNTTISGTLSVTYTIENTGSSALNLTGSPIVSISGTHSSDFTVTSQPSASSIAASSSLSFSVEFEAGALGLRDAEIGIDNNDADEGTYNFAIQGMGITDYDVGNANQKGATLEGVAADDQFGSALAISEDGSIIALGVSRNDANAADAGQVQVFEWDGSTNQWSQKGSDIDGINAGDQLGYAVDLSSDGLTLAIGEPGNANGQVMVYEWSGSAWTQKGSDISGTKTYEVSGQAVKLSRDGNRIVIGAPGYNPLINDYYTGRVRIFEWSGSAWAQIGQDLIGQAKQNYFGQALDFSADGNIVAIGAHQNGDVATSAGQVRLYEYNGSSWIQLGSEINGEAKNDFCGSSVALSSDGKTVAIGAPENDREGDARVFRWSGTAWVQLGDDIEATNAHDRFGSALSCSDDGETIAIGAEYNDESGNAAGKVAIYEWSGTAWVKLGLDLFGEFEGDKFSTVALSGDGKTLLASADSYDGVAGIRSGAVYVYELTGRPEIEVTDAHSNEVLDSTTSHGLSNNTYLGGAAIGSSVNHTYTINNIGDLDLTLSGSPVVSVSGTNSGDFSITAQPGSNTLTSLNSTTFTLQFSPSALGLREALVSFTSDDTDEAAFTFAIGGMGFIAANSSISSAAQAGNDVEGLSAGDLSGSAVAISSDGTIVAMGAPEHDYNSNSNSGQAQVIQFSGSSWSQLGNSFYGGNVDDNLGSSLALSSDGTILAMGAPSEDIGTFTDAGKVYVYKWSGSQWDALSHINGYDTSAFFGTSVTLSSDGTRMAVGAPDADIGHEEGYDERAQKAGQVLIYDWNGSAWTLLGDTLAGTASFDSYGAAIDISSEGNVLAIGVPKNDNNANTDAGKVQLYEWSDAAWVQVGADIDGENASDNFGQSVALSSDGKTVVAGAPFNDNNSNTDAGKTTVYQWSGSAWSQLGGAITGDGGSYYAGTGVAISEDGTVVAAGVPGANSDKGLTQLYKLSGSVWSQIGSDIDGATSGDVSGTVIALSNDGNILAVGAPENDGIGTDGGETKVFVFDGVALPVELTYFEANWLASTPLSNPADSTGFSNTMISQADRSRSQSALLTWATSLEENNSHFQVDRSFNGTEWHTIGQVQGQGNSFSPTQYSFTDNKLETQNQQFKTIYYRLKQVDYSGLFEYSDVRTLHIEPNTLNSLQVWPNPCAGDQIKLNQMGNYQIRTLTGQLIVQEENTNSLNIATLDPGTYIITNKQGQAVRFVKH